MPRREHARILGDVLDSLAKQAKHEPRSSLAGLAARANLPHDRLLGYLSELRERGLVTADRLPGLTAKGSEFLACYRAWVRVQALYGLGPPPQVGMVSAPISGTPLRVPNESYAPLKAGEFREPL